MLHCRFLYRLYLTKKVKHRTSVKGTTLSPVWNEQFEFVVHSTDHQRLHLELWGERKGLCTPLRCINIF